MANQGHARPTGALAAEKNAPTPIRGGVSLAATWVTARYQDGQLTLSVGGSATYGDGVTAGATREIQRQHIGLEKAMAAVLKRYGARIEAEAMTAAYEARALAVRRGDMTAENDDEAWDDVDDDEGEG
jgi:hypothetical protein